MTSIRSRLFLCFFSLLVIVSAGGLVTAAPQAGQSPFGMQVSFDGRRLAVTSVTPGSRAEKGGLRAGDVIHGGVPAGGRQIPIGQLGSQGLARLLRTPASNLVVYRGTKPLLIPVDGRVDEGGAASQRRPAQRRPTGGSDTLVLRPVSMRDEGLGMDSHVAMVPQGWQLQGGVRWTMHPYHYVHFVARLESPDGAAVSFDFTRTYKYGNFERRMGQTLADGTVMRSPVHAVGATAAQFIVPGMRPSARNIRVVHATRVPEAERRIRESMATTLRMQDQQNAQDRQMGWAGSCQASTWIRVENVRVSYDEGGRAWEEQLLYSVVGSHISIQNPNIRSESGLWNIMDTKTARAPRGQLDGKLAMLMGLARSIRMKSRWAISLNRLNMKISQIRHRGNMRTLRSMMDQARRSYAVNSKISDDQMRSWRRQQAIKDRSHRAAVNSIRGVEDYRTTDGSTLAIDNTYDRVFQDSLGNVIMTNDPSYSPGADQSVNNRSWDQLRRIR